jgi:tetratricopeptide (TPR) repeat protein
LKPFDRRARHLACALFLSVYLGACATSPQTRLLLDNPPDVPPRIELAAVPFFPQQEYYCGPAALAGIINYRGTAVMPDQIAELVYVPELKGSLQVEIVAAARQFDLVPVRLDGRLEALLREIAAGNPVFVLQNLALDVYPLWHYEILIGYDLDQRHMILRSGVNRRITRSFALFEKTWQRADHWALALVTPDSIPATASADTYLDAVVDLEQVGRIDTARIAYATALRRWPENLLAHTGLGNSAYAMGEFSAAESAYRAALAIEPQNADVWNNLAYTLAQLGRYEASLQAINRALEIDPDNQNYKDSYSELGNWQQ